MTKMTKELVSAIKRKDLKEIVALILESEEKTEAAKEFREASRITTALIDRTCVDEVETEETEETEETTNGSIEEHQEIIDAIAAGKAKKAKKLLKAAVEGGMKGAIIKDFKKQIKQLKKDA